MCLESPVVRETEACRMRLPEGQVVPEQLHDGSAVLVPPPKAKFNSIMTFLPLPQIDIVLLGSSLRGAQHSLVRDDSQKSQV